MLKETYELIIPKSSFFPVGKWVSRIRITSARSQRRCNAGSWTKPQGSSCVSNSISPPGWQLPHSVSYRTEPWNRQVTSTVRCIISHRIQKLRFWLTDHSLLGVQGWNSSSSFFLTFDKKVNKTSHCGHRVGQQQANNGCTGHTLTSWRLYFDEKGKENDKYHCQILQWGCANDKE